MRNSSEAINVTWCELSKIVLILVLTTSTGCIPIPPAPPITEDLVPILEDGSTTRDDIISSSELSESVAARFSFGQNKVWVYRYSAPAWRSLFGCGDRGCADARDNEHYYLVLRFDESDRLVHHEIVPRLWGSCSDVGLCRESGGDLMMLDNPKVSLAKTNFDRPQYGCRAYIYVTVKYKVDLPLMTWLDGRQVGVLTHPNGCFSLQLDAGNHRIRSSLLDAPNADDYAEFVCDDGDVVYIHNLGSTSFWGNTSLDIIFEDVEDWRSRHDELYLALAVDSTFNLMK